MEVLELGWIESRAKKISLLSLDFFALLIIININFWVNKEKKKFSHKEVIEEVMDPLDFFSTLLILPV